MMIQCAGGKSYSFYTAGDIPDAEGRWYDKGVTRLLTKATGHPLSDKEGNICCNYVETLFEILGWLPETKPPNSEWLGKLGKSSKLGKITSCSSIENRLFFIF